MRRLIIPALTILLTLAGCTTSNAQDQELRDRDWTLVSVDGAPSVPSDQTAPTIRFGSDGRLSGNTGCNSASADFTVNGDRLTIGMMISTKRACLEQRRNELERAYMAALNATRRFRIVKEELELLDESGSVVARFR
jgi:heat shock protein HslJ